jgi:hypothetical protein
VEQGERLKVTVIGTDGSISEQDAAGTLEWLQQAVGGPIEARLFPGDWIAGPMVVVGFNPLSGNDRDLPDHWREHLVAKAVTVVLPGGLRFRAAAVADVIRSKRLAGRDKDVLALPEILQQARKLGLLSTNHERSCIRSSVSLRRWCAASVGLHLCQTLRVSRRCSVSR